MNSDCLQGDPIQSYQIFLGFIAFAIFFAIVISCQTSGAKNNKNKQKQIKKVWKKAPPREQIEYNQRFTRTPQNLKAKPIIQSDAGLKNIHRQKDQQVGIKIPKYKELERRINYIKDQGPKIFMKQTNLKKTLKNLVDYAYHYPQKEYQMLNIYRSEQEIIKEREAFIRRDMPKDQVIPKINDPTNINDISFKKQSNFKRSQSFFKAPSQKTQKQIVEIDKKSFEVPQSKPLASNIQNNEIKKIDLSNKQIQNKGAIFGQKTNLSLFSTPNNTVNIINTTNLISQPPKVTQFISTGLFQKKVQQPQNIAQKKQEKPTIPTHSIQKTKQVQNKIQKKQQPIIQKQPVIKPKQVQKPTDIKTPKQTIKQENNKEEVNQIKKISNSSEYLDAIVKYSEKFVQKTEIATKIGNLDGARSDPKDLWQFTTNYITTIDAKNNDELVTFTYKIWQAIVHKFMKNTNIKDGFQKIPPKERNKQVYKNQINTYVLFVTIYRTLGYEQIWLGVFGKTLKMLNFLLKRKQVVKSWKKLDLLQNNYINKEGNIGQKYLTRIDFLTYFLLALTTFDPIQAFQEVAQKTGENYPFLNELKKTKYKWSYKQFWCLVQSMRKNPFQGYFKIPFWNNALSVIYLPIMKSLKQGHMKEFVVLSKWIFKECKELTKKIDKAEQSKFLIGQIEQTAQYQFDGEQFISSVKSLGKAMQTRERQMKITRWQDFRDRCSIFYFFWRVSS